MTPTLQQGDTFVTSDGHEATVSSELRYRDGVRQIVVLRVTYRSVAGIKNRTFRFWTCGPNCGNWHRAEVQ